MSQRSICWGGLCVLLLALPTLASGSNRDEAKIAETLLLKNIVPPGTKPGVVVASPSQADPDYYFHWVRDASLVFDVIVKKYEDSLSTEQKQSFFDLILNFVHFSRKNQLTPNLSGGLGEPKFNTDGTAFNGSWGRPQNDGPAIRASSLIRFANRLIREGQMQVVKTELYDGRLPTASVIKADLEFVSHHWQESSYDLWEEIKGDHFYTRMVQRKALVEGAKLAFALGDPNAGDWYLENAKAIEKDMGRFWDSQKQLLIPTLNRVDGIHYKTSGIDTCIVLAILHGDTRDGFLSFTDDKVLASVVQIRDVFQKLYPINQKGLPGTAIGRYPEDRYDGKTTNARGNPWVLLTNAYAEFYYRAANRFEENGQIEVNATSLPFFQFFLGQTVTAGQTLKKGEAKFAQLLQSLRDEGDRFLARTDYHANADGSLSEQIERNTGFMQSARDLSWSYASFLTATWAK